jgi:uncharacterized protein
VRPHQRIVSVDILRGFAVLGILLVNMLSFSGYFHIPPHQLTGLNRAAVLLIKFVAQAKFYTLFSFLFGWGMAIQMERAGQREDESPSPVPFYVRRLLILLLIGLAHAILIWDGDILVTYALLGLLLLLFRKRSGRTLLVVAVICLLIPILISTPGPAASLRAAYDGLREPLRRAMLEGYRANVLVEGSYAEAVAHRVKALLFGHSGILYTGPHVFGMFLLGLYVGRRRILHDIPAHLPLFRRVLRWGLIVGLPCNLLFVAATNWPDLVPSAYAELATRGARTIAGSALSLFYVSAIVLLTRRRAWLHRLMPLAAVGRTALSNYLLQSIVGTFVFYGYGLGLYGELGLAITLALTFLLFRAQVGLSEWWLGERFRFGPAEWLWRSLSYGKLQPMKPERDRRNRDVELETKGPPVSSPALNWAIFVGRRLLFIAAVAFAIVYFCALGLRLAPNSTAIGQTPAFRQQIAPALEQSFDFFAGLLQGDLGHVPPDVSRRDWAEVMPLLLAAYADSAKLLLVAVGLATLIGVIAGGLAATRRHSSLSLSTLTLTVIGVSIPSFFLALLLQIGSIAFYKRTGVRLVLFGPGGPGQKSLLPRMTLPALVLVARPLAHITRVTFISVSEILEQDYVRTAHAKGLDPRLVFLRHTLPNAGVSVLTAVVVSLRFALGSLPVAEIFFNWPGLGVTMLNGIFRRQLNVVAGAALGLGVTFLLINLVVDLLYRLIDPRLRTSPVPSAVEGHGEGSV